MSRARTLLVDSYAFDVRGAGDAAPPGRRLRFDDPLAALLWLRRVAAAPGAAMRLRRFLGESTGAAGLGGWEDEDVLRQLARLLASGRVEVSERPWAALTSFGGAGDADAEAAADEAAFAGADEAGAEGAEPDPRSWITIELVGEDDEPIPGARYRVELPDGSLREGWLDGRGLARFFEIDPGSCVVTFPDLDKEAWVPIGTTAEP